MTMLNKINQNLRDLLPHRYPMDLIDKIVSYDKNVNQIVCQKNITIDEPFFQGHFPGHPVMPGCLIIECMAQTAGYLRVCHYLFAHQAEINQETIKKLGKQPGFLAQVERFKFIRPIVPGDTMLIKCHVMAANGSTLIVQGTVLDGDNNVADSGSVMVTKK